MSLKKKTVQNFFPLYSIYFIFNIAESGTSWTLCLIINFCISILQNFPRLLNYINRQRKI
ncbi:hypothetical protein BpHYR1_011870 [Brachionus plicatilis]|uniref:Uncharacterized protein n=1 Tax=Brachionus plicatilis TaxID=10195 RepID=A0A3M7SYE0_BRAPC|nr:hypothetical protein BpHYR1_011870 [Brachionus plicatilis]